MLDTTNRQVSDLVRYSGKSGSRGTTPRSAAAGFGRSCRRGWRVAAGSCWTAAAGRCRAPCRWPGTSRRLGTQHEALVVSSRSEQSSPITSIVSSQQGQAVSSGSVTRSTAADAQAAKHGRRGALRRKRAAAPDRSSPTAPRSRRWSVRGPPALD